MELAEKHNRKAGKWMFIYDGIVPNRKEIFEYLLNGLYWISLPTELFI